MFSSFKRFVNDMNWYMFHFLFDVSFFYLISSNGETSWVNKKGYPWSLTSLKMVAKLVVSLKMKIQQGMGRNSKKLKVNILNIFIIYGLYPFI